jgi:hypothetical protein
MKESDPDDLRAPALELVIRLLPEGSRAGVWLFGDTVEELVPHGPVDDAWRQRASAAVSAIDNSGQRTAIPEALEQALEQGLRLDPAFRTSIVLLTDGKVDVSSSPMVNVAAARRVLEEQAPALAATGVPVHTVALSDAADWSFLRQLAARTGGLAEKAASPTELSQVFLQALELVAPTERVPVSDRSFVIDPSVREFTALVFGAADETPALVAPDGTVIAPEGEGSRWYRNNEFSMVTVTDPAAGEWRFSATGGSAPRVSVIANLRLEVDPLPGTIPSDRVTEVGMRLQRDGAPIRDPELLSLFDLALEIFPPGGGSTRIPVSRDYPLPPDGEYRVTLPALTEPGRYRIVASVRGETLERELPMTVDVEVPADRDVVSTRMGLDADDPFDIPWYWVAGGVVGLWLLLRLIGILRRRRRLRQWRRRVADREVKDDDALVLGMTGDSRPDRPDA